MGDGAHHHHGSHRPHGDAPRWHHRLREHGRRTMARVQSSCLPLMVAMFLLLGLTWLFEEPGKPVKPFVIFLYAAVPMLGAVLFDRERRPCAMGPQGRTLLDALRNPDQGLEPPATGL